MALIIRSISLLPYMYLVVFARQTKLPFLIDECAKLLRGTAFFLSKVPNVPKLTLLHRFPECSSCHTDDGIDALQ